MAEWARIEPLSFVMDWGRGWDWTEPRSGRAHINGPRALSFLVIVESGGGGRIFYFSLCDRMLASLIEL